MKYAVTYSKNFRYYHDVDEVIFPFHGMGDLVKILQDTLTKDDQTAIIKISENPYNKSIDEFIPILNKVKSMFNIVVSINFYTQQNWIDTLKENELSFMFADFATTPSMVAAMAALGAGDIYIAEDLGFQLKELQKVRKKGIRLRVWPDIAQVHAACNPALPQITDFFIRPEDLPQYFSLVDVIEIFTQDRTSVVYEIYKQGQWRGNLSDLIIDLKGNIPNGGIYPEFGKARIECKKRCAYSECDICTFCLTTAEEMDEAGLAFIKKKTPLPPKDEDIKMAEDILNKQEEE